MSDINVSSIQDPWERWVLKKAIEKQSAKIQRDGELELLRHQEQLRSESDIRREERNKQSYSKWLLDKKRVSCIKKAADKEKSEKVALTEIKRKEKIMEERARRNFREWNTAKKRAEQQSAAITQQELDQDRQSKKLAKLKAAEAYEQWLIQHPPRILPKPPFINPQSWDNSD
ncbi:hypothetical protein LOD99_12787 [Oopsacas minuta]|uniref:Coiled-coil domain-containing protein n=1 Tax=Oopsacas minuta TaxID=111878 RepID=A0AAV7JD58_9METZ|nr:hypothetical protein LOD99_12787 [Oopsacas minuta]